MLSRRAFIASTVVAALSAGWLRAEPLADEDMAALVALLDAYERAMKAGDVEAMVRTMPPALLQRFAEVAQVSVDEVATQMAQVFAQVPQPDLTGLEIGMRFDLTRAVFGVSDLGRPYVLLPKQLGAGGLLMESPVLALRDEGSWYAVQVDNPMIRALLVQAYPDLGAVEMSKFSAFVELPRE